MIIEIAITLVWEIGKLFGKWTAEYSPKLHPWTIQSTVSVPDIGTAITLQTLVLGPLWLKAAEIPNRFETFRGYVMLPTIWFDKIIHVTFWASVDLILVWQSDKDRARFVCENYMDAKLLWKSNKNIFFIIFVPTGCCLCVIYEYVWHA